MKILHLYSDWKWTGPAEPAIQMCREVQDLGHEVVFACRGTPEAERHQKETVEKKAVEHGLKVNSEFALNRYLALRDTLHDLVALPRYIRREKFDVVHTHLSHDHALGVYATRMIPRKYRPVLVKSLHKREVLDDTFWNRRLLTWLGVRDGILVFTESFRREYRERFGIPAEKFGICPMAVDLKRFDAGREFTSQRQHYGIPEESVVIGIVARFQKYRRMDVFMQAARQVAEAVPDVRFLVIGRSSQKEDTVLRPIRELGLAEHVILTGYLMERYVDTLATLDVFTLMIPGFDGTARAVREALALGKPCVVSDVGMLPDIVQHEKTGLVFERENADSLAASWLRLIRDRGERERMSRNAARDATERFRLDAVGPTIVEFYRQRVAAGDRGA